MKNWRPEGWKNPYIGEDGMLKSERIESFCAYEDSADAILDALFKLAKESPTGTFTIDSRIINSYNLSCMFQRR